MYTLENIMVRPLNVQLMNERLKDFFKKNNLVDEKTEYTCTSEAYGVDVAISISRDCVYSWISPHLMNDRGKPTIELGVVLSLTKKTKTESGYSHEFGMLYLIPYRELMQFCHAPIPLKHFQDTRHNYNPRIKSNQRLLLEDLNERDSEQ